MSPFKEPQPRKDPSAGTPIIPKGGNWPPYVRTGDEARWVEDEPKPLTSVHTAEELAEVKAHADIGEWANQPQPPIMVVPDHTAFMARKAALEAACAIQRDGRDAGMFWRNIGMLEEYLRHGIKPS